MLPKTAEPEQVAALDSAMTTPEDQIGLAAGAIEMVPNVELALGLIHTYAICKASPRISACLVATEVMAADLGAEHGRDGVELAYARARFHVECVAAGVLSIDCPYTWTVEDGLAADTHHARRVSYTAKSVVKAEHAAIINRLLTPSPDEIRKARDIAAAFEAAQARGKGRAELDGSLVEVPIYNNAKRLLERARALGVG